MFFEWRSLAGSDDTSSEDKRPQMGEFHANQETGKLEKERHKETDRRGFAKNNRLKRPHHQKDKVTC